jgi:hypothetical protein
MPKQHPVFTQKNLQDVFTKPPTSDEAPAAHLEDLNSIVADLFSVNADSVENLADSRPFSLADSDVSEPLSALFGSFATFALPRYCYTKKSPRCF